MVESPGSRKRRRDRVDKEKENAAATKSTAALRRRSSKARGKEAKPSSTEEVLVLVSSDAEGDPAAAHSPRAEGPSYRSPTSASEAGTDAEEDEEDEWLLPPNAQRR